MSIAVSTIPSVKAYFFTQLQARTEFTATAAGSQPVGVFYDQLGKNIPHDYVMVGDVRRKITVARMVGGGGTGWLDETYELTVLTQSFRGGNTPQVVYERAALLADVVVDMVRLDPSLGGRVIQCNPLDAEYRGDWSDDNKGRLVQVIQPFEVFATI